MFLFSISFELVSKSILLTSITAWIDVFISSRSFLAWACTGVRMELVWVSSQRFTSLEDEKCRVVSVNDASLYHIVV